MSETELDRLIAMTNESLRKLQRDHEISAGPCTECIHAIDYKGLFAYSGSSRYLQCRCPLVAPFRYDPTRGQEQWTQVECAQARTLAGKCGPEGQFFQAVTRPVSWWRRLLNFVGG